MRENPRFYFWSEIWRHYIVFLDANFLCDEGIPANREHLRQKLAHLCLHGLAQNCDVKGKIWEWVVRCWPQRTCSYSWGCYLCATFGENWSRNATVRVRTDRHTLWQRQPEFIICPMLYIGWQWRNFFISYLCLLFFRHFVGQALRNVSYSNIAFLARYR